MLEEIKNIIRELDTSRAAMHAAMAITNQTSEIYPGWTLKQLLAHITGWDEAARASIAAHMRYDEAMIPAFRGVNEYNEESVRTRGALSYELVVREYEHERERLKALLGQINDDRWNEKMLLPWGGYGQPLNLVRVWQRHELDHANELEELAARKGIIVSAWTQPTAE